MYVISCNWSSYRPTREAHTLSHTASIGPAITHTRLSLTHTHARWMPSRALHAGPRAPRYQAVRASCRAKRAGCRAKCAGCRAACDGCRAARVHAGPRALDDERRAFHARQRTMDAGSCALDAGQRALDARPRALDAGPRALDRGAGQRAGCRAARAGCWDDLTAERRVHRRVLGRHRRRQCGTSQYAGLWFYEAPGPQQAAAPALAQVNNMQTLMSCTPSLGPEAEL